MSSQATFIFDDQTDKAIEELKEKFGVKTKAEVIRKSLKLASLAQKYKDPKLGTVTLSDGHTKNITVVL